MNADAYNAALRRLSAKEYASQELAAYLERKGFTAEDSAEVIARLIEQKFLDDSRYARMMVRYQAGRGKGAQYIRMKLIQKGVSLPLPEIKRILGEVSDKSEVESAREIANRKYPSHKTDRDIRLKALQALVRRGFTFDVAKQALNSTEDLE